MAWILSSLLHLCTRGLYASIGLNTVPCHLLSLACFLCPSPSPLSGELPTDVEPFWTEGKFSPGSHGPILWYKADLSRMEAGAYATSCFAQILGLGFLMQSSQDWSLWQLFCPNAITYGFAHLEEDQVEIVLQYNQLIHLSWKTRLSSALVEELQRDFARKQRPLIQRGLFLTYLWALLSILKYSGLLIFFLHPVI